MAEYRTVSCYRKGAQHAPAVPVLLGLATVPLQLYFKFLALRGHTGHEAPPPWEPQKDRALSAAAMGVQRASGGSKQGLDHLLQPGLGEQEHINQARRLRSPFAAAARLDSDLEFAFEAYVVFGSKVAHWRAGQHAHLQAAADALQPLRQAL